MAENYRHVSRDSSRTMVITHKPGRGGDKADMNELETAKNTLERVMSNQDEITRLTDNQIDLLIRVALGKTNSQIADELCLQEQTVKNRVTRLLKKLHVDNRVHIATFACLGYPPSESQLRFRWRDLNKKAVSSGNSSHLKISSSYNQHLRIQPRRRNVRTLETQKLLGLRNKTTSTNR